MAENRQLPRPPDEKVLLAELERKDLRTFWRWLYNIHRLLSVAYGLAWAVIDKSGASIADIPNRSHTSLQDIGTHTHAQIDALIEIEEFEVGTSTPTGKKFKIIKYDDGTFDWVEL